MAKQPEESVSSPRQKFHEVFQPKQGRFSEFPPSRISDMMKSNSLDNAPTQSLLSVVNGILDESIKGQNGGIPDRVACLLRKVVQEIERRISTQAEHIRNQNNLFKAREDKYQSRIKVLETLATGTNEAAHTEKTKVEEKKVKGDQDVVRLMKEKEDSDLTILKLKEELEVKNKSREEHFHQLEVTVKEATKELMLEKEDSDLTIAKLKAAIEVKTKSLEHNRMTLESKIQEATRDLMKEKENSELMVVKLKEEMEQNKRMLERNNIQFETKIKEITEQWAKEKEANDQMVSKLKMDMETKGKLHDPHQQQLDKEAKDAVEKLLKEKENWNVVVNKLNAEIEMKNKSLEQLHTLLEVKNKETTSELMKGKEDSDVVITKFKEEIETMYRSHEEQRLQLENQIKETKTKLMKGKEDSDLVITKFKEEIETMKKLHEQQCLQLENQIKEYKDEISTLTQAGDLEVSKLKAEIETKTKLHDQQSFELIGKLDEAKNQLEEKKKELQENKSGSECAIEELRKRCKELEELSNTRLHNWQAKENVYCNYVGCQLQALQDLRMTSSSIKSEVIKTQKCWHEEYATLGRKLKELAGAAETCHMVLEENRRLYNEVQELKGNIRVFCRIRPFLPGENGKQSTVDYIGENGELLIVNPSKQGKDGHRMFKFNKVFGPQASQEEVYLDTQPLVRSTLDGFNVCIFAYGQTGSGKTYTMSGPTSATKENWGVNYRALNDLFDISQSRSNAFNYEIEVQMVEIYNEQVRDLLSHDTSQKRLGIRSTSQTNGLAVPDASTYPVNTTNDVLQLMQVGQTNRAMSATALNERSSRSHSVLSIHVRGTDLKTGASLRGCLHLVDLAGSERVDRSEVTGERLREAQHINKSLSALGDVIYALSQKSSHVPYRNSKLTQLLQNSLGGHAKTLMFVQVNPDMDSYSETSSTLKFAERASGVELGAAKSSKEGKDVKELMEQVAHLKDIIATKDEEMEQLLGNNALNHSLSSPNLHHLGNMDKLSDMDPQSMDNFQFQSKTASRPKSPLAEITGTNPEERLSSFQEEDYDVSEGDISGGNPENLEAKKIADIAKIKLRAQSPRSPTQRTRLPALTPTKLKESPKSALSPRRTVNSQTSASKSSPSSKRRQ